MATVFETKPASESDVWQSVVKGDTNAFEQIVVSHQSAVSAVAFNIIGDFSISQDIAQETFWAAWKTRDSLRDTGRLGPWLCGIARNLARQWRRKKARVHEVESEKFGCQFDSFATDPADDFISKEEESVVWNALEQIPSNYREVLVLYYRQGKSIDQVATSLGLTNAAARQRLARGREILRSHVSNMIEGVLDRTNPSRTFTSRVMAGIASMGVAGSSATANASSISMAVKSTTASSAASIAKILASGPAIGVAGGLLGGLAWLGGTWLGVWVPAQLVPTETERQLLLERGRQTMKATILYFLVIIVLVSVLVVMPNALMAYMVALNVSMIVFITAHVLHIRKTQNLVRRLRNELTPAEDPNRSKIGTKFNEKAISLTPRFSLKYTSSISLFGLPLVDVQVSTLRIDSETLEWRHEKLRWAKAWIAIGDVATGAIAIGGLTFGVISIGFVSTGAVSLGLLSIGLVSIGGVAVGGVSVGLISIGGVAVGIFAMGYHAFGGAIGWR